MPTPFDHARSFGHAAADYARSRPAWPDALLDWIAEAAPARGFAIDVGTGAGQGALGLVRRFDRVLATDVSAELLATIPAHPRLRTLAQPAEALDPGEPADAVTVFQALHWFAGEPFWARLRAALGPGGVFVVAGYAWLYVDDAVDAIVHGSLLPALAPHWSPKNRLLLDGYRDVAVPFEEIAAPACAITLAWTRAQLLAYLGTWSAVARLREVEGRDVLAGTALAAVWPGDEARTVRMPVTVRAFRV